MKKILYVTTISGFLPQFEENDVRIAQGLGYEVHYASNFKNPVYLFSKDELKRKGIKLHHIDIEKSPRYILQNMRAIRRLVSIIDKEKIDLIHCHNPMGGVDARIAAILSRRKPKIIYTTHGLHFYKGAPLKNWILYYPAERLLARWTDTIVTVNKEDYDIVRKRFHLRKKGIVERIPGVGIDLERFSGLSNAISKRKELCVPSDAFHIVTAAELNDNKNHKVVIEAIARLANKDIYYTICGRGANEEKLKSLINKLGLNHKVRLAGFRTDIPEILKTADVFVFPSIREGFGMAAVEALATGIPLVVLDNRGTREYAVDGINSIVCKKNSADEFKDAIERLYIDSELRFELAENSKSSAKNFSIERTGRIMEKVYRRFTEDA